MPNIYSITAIFALSFVVMVLGSPVSAADLSPIPAYSPDIHLGHSKGLMADEDIAFPSSSSLIKLMLGALPQATDIDAAHGLADGDLLFSLDTSAELGGVLYRPNDVIRYNGSVWSKEFDGGSEGIPNGVNIDAIAMSGGNLLLSLDVDAMLGGSAYGDADIISFDGADFSLFLDADSAGISRASDVDALHIDDLGRVLVSLDTGGELGGVTYQDEDLLAWDSPDWSMEIDGSSEDAAWLAADMDAWSIIFFDDTYLKDGFESP